MMTLATCLRLIQGHQRSFKVKYSEKDYEIILSPSSPSILEIQNRLSALDKLYKLYSNYSVRTVSRI